MEFDVIIVGGGPSGLAAAIKLKQLAALKQQDISVCILEKGAEIGAHIISGAVLEPASLKMLLPDTWQEAPLDSPVSADFFYYLTPTRAIRLPTPKQMHNSGNFIISLSDLCKFLGTVAESLGCEIYPGFAASELVYNSQGEVIGVATGAAGIDKQGQHTTQYQPGMRLLAKQTLFAEGCRGELSQKLIKQFNLHLDKSPQTYGLGLKEIWRINPEKHKQGHVIHTIGWPLESSTYGGSFIYHLSDSRIAIGYVVGLDYKNPWLSPFEEMQRFKTHPFIYNLLHEGERISYGARALNEGGWQSRPKLTFPGGVLIGDAAGFLNVPKIKGTHTAIASGMLAAEAVFDILDDKKSHPIELFAYQKAVEQSSIEKELYSVRNIRPGFRFGLWVGLVNAFFEIYITRGKSPWTLKNHDDYSTLKPAKYAKKINYPAPDGIITFDRLSSVYLTNTFHEENQPGHLVLKNPTLAIEVNYAQFASPETRYCPAAVYEIINVDSNPTLMINAQNCIHCKTCDIKDPRQNIIWQAPEGGGGPNYSGM